MRPTPSCTARCSLFDARTRIVSADVYCALDRPDRLEVEVHRREVGGGGVQPAASARPGAPVDFYLADDRVFRGLIERSGVRIDPAGARERFVAYAAYDRLRSRAPRASYRYVTDSEVAARIALELGLVPRVETTAGVHERLDRFGDPLRFLRCRAERLGFELAVTGGALYFASTFAVLARSRGPFRSEAGWLRLDFEELAGGAVRGELEVRADGKWRPLDCLDLHDVGDRWNGPYLVRELRHHIDANGSKTVLGLRRTDRPGPAEVGGTTAATARPTGKDGDREGSFA